MFSNCRRAFALFVSFCFAIPLPAHAFETPLSDTAVRDAYFLGQHHDDVYSDFMRRYNVFLPPPKTGPQIGAISFFTPYALTAMYSNQQSSSYSAQQAQIDHDKAPEIVRVVVQIWFTGTYGAYIVQPADSHTPGPRGFLPRSPDFWHDFRVRVLQADQMLLPQNASGEPQWNCGGDSGCELAGATLTFNYPATAFTSGAVTIQVTPPEGDPVLVDFDPASLR